MDDVDDSKKRCSRPNHTIVCCKLQDTPDQERLTNRSTTRALNVCFDERDGGG